MKRVLVLTFLLLAAGLALAANMELTSARLYKKQGEWLKSYEFYNESLKKDPANLDAYLERGELLKDIAADPSKADIAKAIAGDAPNPQLALYDLMLANFKQATEAKNSKDEKTAKKNAKKIDDMLQMEWGKYYFNAVVQDSIYNTKKEAGAPAAELQPLLQSALQQLDVATRLMPARWNTYGFKAQIYGKMDSTAASADYWQQAIQHLTAADPEKQKSDEYVQGLMIARENLLVDCYNLERRDCVLEQADAILATDPANPNAIQLKANTLAMMTADSGLTEEERNRMRQEAISALEKARETRPDDPDILYTIGQFHLQSGDTTSALKAVNESLAKNPNDEDALFLTGVIYLEGGSHVDTPKARDMFKRVTEVNENNAAAWTNYGVALIRLGNAEEGKAAIERAKKLSSQ